MDLLQMIMSAQGGGAVQHLSQRFGLDEGQTASALEHLVPALMGGMQQNVQSGGLEGLLGMLGGGNASQILDNPEAVHEPETTETGNSLLGQLLGSKEVSRSVASEASANTGIGADILKQMLPVVATMVMSGMSKQQGSSQGGLLGMLDSNNDGSIADDVLGLAAKFLQR
ncbi:MAG: DUF937 domain-containing protein [Acidobacteria bacterium]|nr:DUF937 domain-containing protein [Acidobacteriota bacterium]